MTRTTDTARTSLKLAGEYYTIIREGAYTYYLYTTATDYDHDDATLYRSKNQAIKQAKKLAQIRRDANTAAAQTEIDDIRAELKALINACTAA